MEREKVGERKIKNSVRIILAALTCGMVISSAACSSPATPASAPAPAPNAQADSQWKQLNVGFSQIGEESGWRAAETKSIKDTAAKLGVNLKFADAQQKQEDQIKAIRTFIQQKVDVIGVSPVVETGWDTVFQEAKNAGIPVVLVDRSANCPNLFATFIGSDFIKEGQDACDMLADAMGQKGNVVELEGTVGASAATERKKGFDDQLAAKYPNMKIIASQSGDFTRDGGKKVMEAFLKANPQIDGVFGHNDDMCLGAIEAIKDAGKKPGTDIKIVGCDGVKGMFQAMVNGEANGTAECNPLLGPQFFQACLDLKNGKTLPAWIKSTEGVFPASAAAAALPNRQY